MYFHHHKGLTGCITELMPAAKNGRASPFKFFPLKANERTNIKFSQSVLNCYLIYVRIHKYLLT